MFARPTTFIIGAGASCEAGLPSGNELTQIIAKSVDMNFEFGSRQNKGDSEIWDALKELTRQKTNGRDTNANIYFQDCKNLSAAVFGAQSIDNYLEAHQENEKAKIIAKIAIAKAILTGEKNSKIYKGLDRSRSDNNFTFSQFSDTWYMSLHHMLVENASKENFQSINNNINFIIFNYDRCVEHFLYHAIKQYYHSEDVQISEVMQKFSFFHPYGQVGSTDWSGISNNVPLGSDFHTRNSDQLLAIAQRIKTFTEQIEDKNLIQKMKEKIEQSETLVFLGFAFHKQNMDLIRPEHSKVKRVFATGYGMSKSDCDFIQSALPQWLSSRSSVTINVEKGMKCAELMQEYRHSITQQRFELPIKLGPL
jgi:hypothetical protein